MQGMNDFSAHLSPQMKRGNLERTASLNAEEQARIRSKYQKIFVAEAYLGPPEILDNEIEIYSPISPRTGKECAVKLLHLTADELSDEDINAFQDDVKRLSSARHPNICLFMGATVTGPLLIVTELMHTNLSSLVNEGTHLSLFQRLLLVKDVALAMNWLHDRERPIFHGNLTPSNILVTDTLHVKISDYGLTKIKEIQKRNITKRLNKEGNAEEIHVDSADVGAKRFSAPEELIRGEKINDKNDVYSFSIILWMVVTKKTPFSEIKTVGEMKEALARGFRPEIPVNCIPSLKSLVEDCWNDSPQKRPPFKAILKRFEAVIVDSAILDQNANLLWRKYFKDTPFVNWTEFLDVFAMDIALIPGSVASLSKLINSESTLLTPKLKLQIDILRALLVDKRSSLTSSTSSLENDVVSLEVFGRLVSWLGPLYLKTGSGKSVSIRSSTDYETNINFVDRIYSVISQPWFHGLISAEESERLLMSKPVGTFIVRFSTAAFGVFTITKVANSNTIHHQRVLHVLETDLYQIQDRFYPSLPILIEKEKERLQLLAPCPGSKFAAIMVKEQNGGYI